MPMLKKILLSLRAVDVVVISFAIVLNTLNIVFYQRVDNWLVHVTLNTFVSGLIILLAYLDKYRGNILWQQLHYWYPVPLIFAVFKQFYFLVKPIRGVDYDDALIEIDRFMFGGDPTIFLNQYSHPVLTELLQIVYATFFFLPVILGINLLLNDKEKEFHFMTSAVVLGFFLSYIGYLLVPAIGPRFTLHDFDLKNIELPGLFLTNYLREIVNAGESIPAGTLNPAEVVQRDVFPSGHTQMTLIVMYLSVKFKSCFRYFFLVNGSLLIFSTVYLRYHYVIDVMAGFAFMALTIFLAQRIYNRWMEFRGDPKLDF